jgi:hypothetical protein
MRKQLFSHYNIGTIVSVIFQERLGVMWGYPSETLCEHSYSQSLNYNFKSPCIVSRDMQSKSQYLRITV